MTGEFTDYNLRTLVVFFWHHQKDRHHWQCSVSLVSSTVRCKKMAALTSFGHTYSSTTSERRLICRRFFAATSWHCTQLAMLLYYGDVYLPLGVRMTNGYTNWARGQPSCGLLLCLEHCAQLRFNDGGRWHDYMCDNQRDHYICQFCKWWL